MDFWGNKIHQTRKGTLRVLTTICLAAGITVAAFGQLPIRNFINLSAEQIYERLDAESLYYETADNNWDPDATVREVSISVFKDQSFTWPSNDAYFYVAGDSCYQVQYNFYEDEFILDNLRSVLEKHPAFTACPNMPDCWEQTLPDRGRFYWNLFKDYNGDKIWDVLIIEGQEAFLMNAQYYENSK